MSQNVGGGFGARLQQWVRAGQDAFNKITKKEGGAGETKGAEGKPDVKGGGQAAGAGGAKAKGKAKGKDASAVDALMRGADDFGVVEDDERERRRRQRFFLGDTSGASFDTKDATEERSAVAHISAEFRGQVASGMVEGRSFTQGSCLVPDTPPEEEDVPKKKKGR
ncbi:MAG: hypothetical protein HY904_03830 [Deltaproteobacteria bacterium]|nr:hypothetical protein [Deltaproteobacteria bacterium]